MRPFILAAASALALATTALSANAGPLRRGRLAEYR